MADSRDKSEPSIASSAGRRARDAEQMASEALSAPIFGTGLPRNPNEALAFLRERIKEGATAHNLAAGAAERQRSLIALVLAVAGNIVAGGKAATLSAAIPDVIKGLEALSVDDRIAALAAASPLDSTAALLAVQQHEGLLRPGVPSPGETGDLPK